MKNNSTEELVSSIMEKDKDKSNKILKDILKEKVRERLLDHMQEL